jgi:ubiquinone/menaquinone biosynthesis C-methylase UbiE
MSVFVLPTTTTLPTVGGVYQGSRESMTTPERVERFKRAVEEEWRNPLVTAAYRKWDREETEWGRHARDLIVRRAAIAPGMRVLDVGSAHGEPGIGIAEAVGPTGRVTLLDIAPDLLELAAERARRAGLAHVETRTGDAHALPFPDGSFDRVTSRLAAMYFADYPLAFREALRVLKPGGTAVYLVWGTFDQPMFRDVIGLLFKYVTPPEDEPDAPSPFRFAEPGTLSGALRDAGFTDVREETVTVPTTFPGEPRRWWEWLVDTAAPVQTWMASMSAQDRERLTADIDSALGSYYDGRSVNLPITVVVASGDRPR